jgi:hypothetical protein
MLITLSILLLFLLLSYTTTALHDACWTPEPQLDVVTLLLNHDIRLLRTVDKRGSSPLQYIRPEHWKLWCSFFDSKKHLYWPDLSGCSDIAGVLPVRPDVAAATATAN